MIKSNFDHFDDIQEFHDIVVRMKRAEKYRHDDIDSAVINCRKALEILVQWIYRNDKELTLPFDTSLCSLLADETFRSIFQNNVLQCMDTVRKLGNKANHESNSVTAAQADFCIEYMYIIMDSTGYCYFDNYIQRKFDKKLFLYPESAEENITASPIAESDAPVASDSRKSTEAEEYQSPDISLTPESVNALLGEPICNGEMTKSELEELLSYLDEGDKTLTDEQKECVNFLPGSDLLIKGTAGSGKSIVLMQRALRLRKQAIKEHILGKVLILTYTNALVTNLSQTVGAALEKNEFIKVSTLDSAALSVYSSIWGPNPPILDFSKNALEKRQEYIRKAKQAIQNLYPNSRILNLPEETLADELQWIKGSDIRTLEEYKRSGRSGRGTSLRFSDADYNVSFQLYSAYNNLLRQNGEMERLDVFSALVQNANRINPFSKSDYVLIDEAQDLQPIIIKFAKLMAKQSITIACDSAQKIYSGSFSLRNLGIEIRGRASKSLSSTFRNTKEISMLAGSLYRIIKEKDASDPDVEFTDPAATTRSGEKPRFYNCESSDQEKKHIVNVIKKYQAENGITIGILYRSQDEKSIIEQWLQEGDIDYQLIAGKRGKGVFYKKVRVCTLHSAKGLEFDIVIIPLFEKSVFPAKTALEGTDKSEIEAKINTERKLVYVGFTRPKEKLFVSFTGEPSMFLSELSRDTYNLWNVTTNGYKHITYTPPAEQETLQSETDQVSTATQSIPVKDIKPLGAPGQDGSIWEHYIEEPMYPIISPNTTASNSSPDVTHSSSGSSSQPATLPYRKSTLIGKHVKMIGTSITGLIEKTDNNYCYLSVQNGPKMGRKIKISWEKINSKNGKYEVIDI